jgi:glycine/D-amino acid oxidase-like deaminating enzyme
MGHLVALDGSEPELALCRLSQRLWREVAPDLPASAHYRAAGTIWIAVGEDDMRELSRKQARLDQHGVPATELDPEGLLRAEPSLRPGLAGGLLVPQDALIDPMGVTQFFLTETRRSGGQMFPGVAVTRVDEGSVRLDRGDSLTAKWILNATGVGAPRLSEGIPVRPRKGHLLRFENVPAPLRHQLVEAGYGSSVRAREGASVAFNAHPAADGTWTVGASREWGSGSTDVDPATVERIRQRAAGFLPGLGGAALAKSWAGLRPAMPDHLPWIGRLPDSESVWVATGHEGLGITCSIGTGRLIVDALQGRRSEIPLEPYLPRKDRVGWTADPGGSPS